MTMAWVHMTMKCVCVTGFIWLWSVFVLQGSCDYDVCLCYRVWRSWTRRRPRGRFRPLTPSTSPAPPASTNSRRRTRDPLTSATYRQIMRCFECAKFWKATEIKHSMTSLLWIKVIHNIICLLYMFVKKNDGHQEKMYTVVINVRYNSVKY